MKFFINRLKSEIAKGLPGKEVQYRMAPSGRLPFFPGKTPVNGSVLILLFSDDKLRVVLMKRTEYKGPHSGQVSFPGGKSEKSDRDLVYTAIREAHEEVGIQEKGIEILGTLTPLYIPPSNFNVLPVVAYCSSIPEFSINTREVKYISTPAIEDFINSNALKYKFMEFFGHSLSIPYFDINGEEVWGATAMIMNEFLEIYRKIC